MAPIREIQDPPLGPIVAGHFVIACRLPRDHRGPQAELLITALDERLVIDGLLHGNKLLAVVFKEGIVKFVVYGGRCGIGFGVVGDGFYGFPKDGDRHAAYLVHESLRQPTMPSPCHHYPLTTRI